MPLLDVAYYQVPLSVIQVVKFALRMLLELCRSLKL